MPKDLAAVLFDMDGLLVDSEELWFGVESEVMTELGAPWSREQQQAIVGGSIMRSAAYMLAAARGPEAAADPETVAELGERTLAKMERRLREGPVAWQPGARELLTNVRAEGVPCALVTASWRRLTAPVLESARRELGGSAEHGPFDVTVAGDDLPRTKPYPDPYLRAAELLGAEPASCVVLEDSPSGASAGLAAGCLVVGVPSVLEIPPAPRLVIRSSLVGLSVVELRELLAQN